MRNFVDNYNYYLIIKNIGLLKTLALGDYRLKFGQGIVLNSQFTAGKSAMLSHINTYSDIFKVLQQIQIAQIPMTCSTQIIKEEKIMDKSNEIIEKVQEMLESGKKTEDNGVDAGTSNDVTGGSGLFEGLSGKK